MNAVAEVLGDVVRLREVHACASRSTVRHRCRSLPLATPRRVS
jgi:hypothetical protein